MKAARRPPAYDQDFEAGRPYRVVIEAGAKRGKWGAYPTIESAAAVAAKLRAHGMSATVESDEGPA